MKHLWITLIIFIYGNLALAQLTQGLFQAETATEFAYSGTGWVQIVDGDYVVMESSVLGDSVSLEFEGATIIIYREILLLADNPATVEICIDGDCTNITNLSSENQRRVPVSFATSGASPHSLTITNTDGGLFRLDYIIVMPDNDLLTTTSPSPSMDFLTLDSGRVVAVDFSITGGEITLSIFMAFLSALTMYKIVMDRWHHA